MHKAASPGKNAGISLMEALVVIAIMASMLVVVVQIFVINYDIFLKQSSRADNETGAILAVRQISEMARGAAAVEASRTINGTAYVSSSSAVILKLPARDASGNVLTGIFDYIAFSRDPVETAKIFGDTEAGAGSARPPGKRLVTGNNNTMTFRYNDNDLTKASRISLHLVNSQSVRGTTVTTEAWTSLFLRNK